MIYVLMNHHIKEYPQRTIIPSRSLPSSVTNSDIDTVWGQTIYKPISCGQTLLSAQAFSCHGSCMCSILLLCVSYMKKGLWYRLH